jgi:uncharacterized membrane protein YagU involved in acid resistance
MTAIVAGGVVAGVLDITSAFIIYGLRGVTPTRILQSISSGLLGREAYDGGVGTAVLGLGLHFLIALVMAAVYVGLSQRLPALLRYPVPFGLAYGVGAYFVMHYVVLPLSAVGPRGGFNLELFLLQIVVHALLIGLPIALLAARCRRKPATRGEQRE